MRDIRSFLLLLAWALPIWAQAAGFSFFQVPPDASGAMVRGAVWYPCPTPAGEIRLGPLVLQGTQDCPMRGDRLPLVVMSHGSGGSMLAHHDTAAALADAGFVVAAINHPGDNFQDLDRQGQLSILASRPADIKRLVDYMLQGWRAHARLDAARVGMFGFSRGGYTGLVAVGAVPDPALGLPWCAQSPAIPMCGQVQRGERLARPLAHDARIKAAVVADPIASVFSSDGLKQVSVPIMLWASARGGDGIDPASVDALRDRLPTPPTYRVAANADHFGFLAPCSAAMRQEVPEICTDTPDFDRLAFHKTFNAEVIAFFQTVLR